MTMLGIKHSEATKRKISRANKGNPKLINANRGERAYNYKGGEVGYGALHEWVRRWLGKPNKCENCGATDKKRYEWANISGDYLRDLGDWARLCKSCHCLIDNVGNKVWAKRRGRR